MRFLPRRSSESDNQRDPAQLRPLVAAFVLLLAYPLSVGPVCMLLLWMVDVDWLSWGTGLGLAMGLCAPLDWLGDRVGWFDSLMNWYVDLFCQPFFY